MSHACHRFWKCYKTLAKPHLNFQKWSEPLSFWHFWLGNVLRATTACTFSTSQLPKVVGEWRVLYILTWKCASRHNCVHFFDISTCKSGPTLVRFVRFDFEICFAPQLRSLFRHLNFQKWPEHEALCTFWFPNVLRVTTACNFSSLIWPDGSAAAALASLPFRPSRATNHLKNTVFRDFPTLSRTCIFFLLTLSLLWSSLFCSSLLWLFPPLLFHLSILSEVWLLNFLWLSADHHYFAWTSESMISFLDTSWSLVAVERLVLFTFLFGYRGRASLGDAGFVPNNSFWVLGLSFSLSPDSDWECGCPSRHNPARRYGGLHLGGPKINLLPAVAADDSWCHRGIPWGRTPLGPE